MASDKTPRPDGFQPLFCKTFWSIIKDDIIAAIKEFFSSYQMAKDWKATYIVWILKKNNPREEIDYRLLAYVVLYMSLLLKVWLTSWRLQYQVLYWMNKVLLPLIEIYRSIIENIMVTQQLFHSMGKALKIKKALMVVKANIEKAYDRMSWRFLDAVLKHYSFHNKFIRWIMCCIQNSLFWLMVAWLLVFLFHWVEIGVPTLSLFIHSGFWCAL